MRAWLGFLVLLFAACGEETPSDDPGTGTNTLLVRATAIASPNLIDARMATDFQTVFTVRLTLATQSVSTGTVAITSETGKIPLTYRDGVWRGSAPSYDETYTLDVQSGDNRVEGVRLDGPDIQIITAPLQGATIDADVGVTVEWQRERPADHTQLIVDPDYPVKIPDTGHYEVGPYILRADNRQSRQNTIHLIRTNTVAPAGGVSGSQFDVQIQNEVDVEAMPTAKR